MQRGVRLWRCATVSMLSALVVAVGGHGVAWANPPADGLAPPNFLDDALWGLVRPVVGATVSVSIPGTVGAAPVATSCQWQDGGTGSVGATWMDISGAVSCSAYTVPASLRTHWLRAKLTASNGVGSTSVVTFAYRVGGEIVFSTYQGFTWPRMGIAVMNEDGTGMKALTPANNTWDSRGPDVSPDGTQIVFASTESSPLSACSNTSGFKVWIMNSDGSGRRSIHPATAAPETEADYPHFSPDGTRIAWVETCSANQRVHVMGADGTGDRVVYTSTTPTGGSAGAISGVGWQNNASVLIAADSPDNAVFVAATGCWSGGLTYMQTVGYWTGCGAQYFSTELITVPASGGAITQLTFTDLLVSGSSPPAPPNALFCSCHRFENPMTEANGGALFSASGSFNTDLFPDGIYKRASTGTITAFPNGAALYQPSLSPDGSQLVAWASSWDLYRMNIDGTGKSQIGPPGLSIWPTWTFLAEPTPALPIGQTYGDEFAMNAGDSGDVNASTGNFSVSSADIILPGIDLSLQLSRYYNSTDSTVSDFGPGWNFSYGSRLTIAANGDVTARASDGQLVLFIAQTDGSYRPYAGATASLLKTASTYEMKTDARIVYVYDLDGRLATIQTPNGRQVGLAYDASGKLDAITDTVGRLIDVQFDLSGVLTKFLLSDGRSVSFAYDAGGRLSTVTDLRGKVWTYTYDGATSRLASILDPNGHYPARVTYDPSSGRVAAVQNARGNQTAYAWDPLSETATITDEAGKQWRRIFRDNRLVTRTDPFNKATSYSYDRQFNPTKVTDALAKVVKMTYGPGGSRLTLQAPATLGYVESAAVNASYQPTALADGRGNTTTVTYDARGNKASETLPGNRTTTYGLDPITGLTTDVTDSRGKTTRFTYDAQGNRTSATSPLGNKTTWTYDAFGRVLSVVSPLGNCSGCTAADYTTSYTYDNGSNKLTETDPLGNVTTFTHDGVGNLTSFTNAAPFGKTWAYQYDEANQRTKEIAPNTAAKVVQYDVRDNVAATIDPLGNKTTYTYDDAGRRLSMVSARGNCTGCTPSDYTTAYEYDAVGNLTKITDPLGNTTQYGYDDLNRRVSMTDPRGKTTGYAYDGAGNVASITNPLSKTASAVYNEVRWPTSQTDYRGKTTTFTYDNAGNRLSATTPLGNTTTWAYDDDGRRTSKVTPLGNCSGCMASSYTWTYAYDNSGNQLAEANPLGQANRWTYDRAGRKASSVDANGRATAYSYDELGRLKTVIDPMLDATRYAYDDVGNLVQRTDAKGRVSTYGYDLSNRLTGLTLPGPTAGTTRVWTYEYDEEGHRTKRTDANGNATPGNPSDGITTSTFDRVGRPSGTSYSDSTPASTYTYDANGNRLAMVDGQPSSEARSYDDLNRLVTVTRGSDVFSYGYDDNGNVTQRTFPDSTVVATTYDDDNRMATAVTAAKTTTYAYDADGNLTSTRLPSSNGYVESRTYDRAGRLTQIKSVKGSATLSTYALTLDPVGNPTKATKAGTDAETYTYDARDRITEVCYKASGAACTGASDPFVRWTYDEVGNRLTEKRGSEATTTYTYNNADQLTASGPTAYAYDANGQQVAAGTRTFAWNAANEVASSTASGSTVAYSYDGDGARVRSVVGATTVNYQWDKNHVLPQLASERDGSNGLLRRYISGLSTIGQSTSAGDFYFHRDSAGSVTNVTDASGVTQWTRLFEPFGLKRTETNNSGSAPAVPLQYTGEYSDPTTALYDLRARQYDPSTGRFLSEDPVPPEIADPYVSAYVYAADRPTVFADPSGESVCGFLQISAACEAVAGFNRGADAASKAFFAGTWKLVSDPRSLGVQLADRCAPNGRVSYGCLAKTLDPVGPAHRALRACDGEGARPRGGRAQACGEAVVLTLTLLLPVKGVAAARPGAAVRGAARRLPDDALIVRGGTNTSDRLVAGAESIDDLGRVHRVSVNSAPGRSVVELAQGIKNKQIGVTTVGRIRGAGGYVTRDPRPDNPFHCLIGGLTPDAACGLFTPTIRNPTVP